MFTARFLRIVALTLGLAWLPMTAFAQMCATHSVAMKTGGMQHPAMPQTVEELKATGVFVGETLPFGAVAVVIDAETFWHSVDTYEDNCQAKAVCAFASAAVPPLTAQAIAFDADAAFASTHFSFPRSHLSAPDTPPPRTHS
jgi:hypothetical protein